MSNAPRAEEELAGLLRRVEERERAARRRAILYTLLPILVGITFLGFTSWQVVRAERVVATLRTQEEALNAEKQALEQSIAVLRDQVNTYRKSLQQITADVSQYGGEQLQKKAQQVTPITAEVKLRASADKVEGNVNPSGAQVYKFRLWVDASSETLARIASVRYDFNHPTFPPAIKVQETTDRGQNFPAAYNGWGCLSSVIVTFTLVHPLGPSPKLDFDMCAALRSN